MQLQPQVSVQVQERDELSALLMRPVVTARPDPIEMQLSQQELLEQNFQLSKQVNELRAKVSELEYRGMMDSSFERMMVEQRRAMEQAMYYGQSRRMEYSYEQDSWFSADRQYRQPRSVCAVCGREDCGYPRRRAAY